MESGQKGATGTPGGDDAAGAAAGGAAGATGTTGGGTQADARAAGIDAVVVGVDVTGDGVPDIIGIDADADGAPDIVIVDAAMADADTDADQVGLAAETDPETGASDPVYNLVSVLYHALQGAETTAIYGDDADFAGDDELARFFQEVQAQDRARARRAKSLLRKYLAEES